MLKKLITVLGFFITTLIFLQHSFAEINSVEMQVDGMTCPFCVYGIEKKLNAIGEVKDVSSNLKTGTVDIYLKENEKINIDRLNKAIRESGFTPGKIKIEATGKLDTYKLEDKEYPALKVSGSDQVFLLTSKPDHVKEEFLSEEKLIEIKKAVESGEEEITISGYIHPHTAGIPLALSVESFEVR